MHYQWRDENLILRCQIQPRASRNEIIGVHHQYLKIAITSAPVDGKANQQLIKLCSKWFGVSRQNITITHGETGRRKTLLIENPACLPEQALISLSL
ncbi:MAG: DUF167 family protein [Porticoccaceae bacterium]|nr:YggU family protein [Pseudomonadales bacterium]MCP5173056.1 YggU family protein [Pseudomonadales bacterium]MCP5302530.1 YggU family protein [Pseudomonadales bacterium]